MPSTVTKNSNGTFTIVPNESFQRIQTNQTLDQVKAYLIKERKTEFMLEAIQIDMSYPAGFYVDGQRQSGTGTYLKWVGDTLSRDNAEELVEARFNQITNV